MGKLTAYLKAEQLPLELSRNGRCLYRSLCNEGWHTSAGYRCAWLVHHQVGLCPRFVQRERAGGRARGELEVAK